MHHEIHLIQFSFVHVYPDLRFHHFYRKLYNSKLYGSNRIISRIKLTFCTLNVTMSVNMYHSVFVKTDEP